MRQFGYITSQELWSVVRFHGNTNEIETSWSVISQSKKYIFKISVMNFILCGVVSQLADIKLQMLEVMM
jgi:hypothetical protein